MKKFLFGTDFDDDCRGILSVWVVDLWIYRRTNVGLIVLIAVFSALGAVHLLHYALRGEWRVRLL